jgi:PAS domain S-box-containing protein
MESPPGKPAEEIKRLQRCINDLVGVLALPAIWTGGDSIQIARTFVDALLRTLRLDLVYVRLADSIDGVPIEIVRVAPSERIPDRPQEIAALLSTWLQSDPIQQVQRLKNPVGDGDISVVPMRMGLQGELGVIVGGSQRSDFPEQTESLVLSVAANLAVMGLQEARLLNQQKRLADELDQRVAQRTRELAATNEALKKEIAERNLVEQKLRDEEQELKRSEARKAAILDSALDCIVAMDQEGRITEFNPAAERTFGYRRAEVVGQRLAEVIIPSSLRERHRLGLTHYLDTGQSQFLGKRLELNAVRADGSEFPVELAVTRIPTDGPPSFTGYLRDITERKQSDEELHRGAAFLAEAQRLSSTGSFSWVVATDTIDWSEQLYRIYEFEPAVVVTLELIGSRIHPDDLPLLSQMIDWARGDGRDFEYEHRLLMPDQSVKYLHMVAHGTRNRHGQLEYIGAIQDITERRLSVQALDRARSELAHVARISSLGVLTASIAHEVNQPLSGITTNAGTCLRMLAADPPNVDGARETARRTIRDATRAADVIKRLRALFGKTEAVSESVDLNEASREVIALALSELQESRAIVMTEFAEGLAPVSGDRVQLQQVILNLLRNASEAMSSVDDRPRQLLIRTERDDGDGVRLSVQDAGVGFEPGSTERVFEAFYTTKSSGMGMGLSVSRSIIESHHGKIWAAANEGPGATFSFSIPPAPGGGAAAHTIQQEKNTP